MSRRRRKAEHNPQRAAKHREEAKRREERLNYRMVWTLLVVFDVIVGSYSVGHYLSTGHREVIVNVFVILTVTWLGVRYLPPWE